MQDFFSLEEVLHGRTKILAKHIYSNKFALNRLICRCSSSCCGVTTYSFYLNIFSVNPLDPGQDGSSTTTQVNQPTTQPVNGQITNAPVKLETNKPTTQSGNRETSTQKNLVNVQTDPVSVDTQTTNAPANVKIDIPTTQSGNGETSTQRNEVNLQTDLLPVNNQTNLPSNESVIEQLSTQTPQIVTLPENGQVNVSADEVNTSPTVLLNTQQITQPVQQQLHNQQGNQQMNGPTQHSVQNLGQNLAHIAAAWSKHAPGDKQTVKYETNLLSDILGNYSTGMRPVRSSHVPAVINFDLKLNKLVKLVSETFFKTFFPKDAL